MLMKSTSSFLHSIFDSQFLLKNALINAQSPHLDAETQEVEQSVHVVVTVQQGVEGVTQT